MMRRRSNNATGTASAARGFSMVDLVMVMVIIAVVGAIAVPRYSAAVARYRAGAAARRVQADLDLARHEARRRSADRQITYNITDGQYQLDSISSLDKSSAAYVVDLRAQPYHATIQSAFGLDTGQAFVTFDGFGKPDQGGDIVVKVGDTEATVHLDPTSGKATLP